jgi:hypothetical protein
MSALRARLCSEEGITIVIAIEILAIVMLLMAGVVTSSLALRDSTVRDTNSKGALAASQAGLEAARYRLNRMVNTSITTNPTQCLTTSCPAAESDCARSSS